MTANKELLVGMSHTHAIVEISFILLGMTPRHFRHRLQRLGLLEKS